MGQFEVYDFLKAHPDKWFSSSELAGEIGCSHHSVVKAIRKLVGVRGVVTRVNFFKNRELGIMLVSR